MLGQARLTDFGVDIRFDFAAFGLGEKLVGEEVDPRILPVIGNDGKADPGIRIKAESQDRVTGGDRQGIAELPLRRTIENSAKGDETSETRDR